MRATPIRRPCSPIDWPLFSGSSGSFSTLERLASRRFSACAPGRASTFSEFFRAILRAESVTARLVEIDPELAAAARHLAARAGLSGVEVVVGDASCTDAFVGAVPADLVLVCGVFGNLSDGDVEAAVRAMPELCAEDGFVIWTRHTWPPDLTPRIRRWFAEAGFSERGFSSPGARSYAVGMNQLLARPRPFIANKRLFTFIDPLSRPASKRATLP